MESMSSFNKLSFIALKEIAAIRIIAIYELNAQKYKRILVI